MSGFPVVLIADMDQTLLDSSCQISEENLAAIARLRAAGGGFTVATGRPRRGVLLYPRLLPYITLPMICCNGAALYDGRAGAFVMTRHLPQSARTLAARVLAAHPSFGCLVYLGNGDALCTLRQTELTQEVVLHREQIPAPLMTLAAVPDPWIKLVFASSDTEEIAACAAAIQADSADVNVTLTERRFIEVLPRGVSKGSALQELARLSGLTAEQFVAVGDSTNDLQMLRWSGTGVAVSNADSAVLELGFPVCADHNDGGVADCIRRYVLPRLS